MDNEKQVTVSIEDIKNIINDSIANAINTFGYDEFLQEISAFNMECSHYEDLLDDFLNTELDEVSLDSLESVTDDIQLLTVEYMGFNKEIVVLDCKDLSEIKELLDEAICHCQLITTHYSEILVNLQLDSITYENHISTIYDTIIEQREFFNAVMATLNNINFKDKIDEITDLNSLDDDAKKICIIRLSEMYGNIIGGLDFFRKNNNIGKIYKYIINSK